MQEKKRLPFPMEPQESVSAEEQADNEIEVNNQVIHEDYRQSVYGRNNQTSR